MSTADSIDVIDGADEPGDSQETPPTREWEPTSIAELIDRIVNVHHARLRQELPRLLKLADAIVAVHGARYHEIAELHTMLATLKEDLESHMLKEEWAVFPKIKCWETARSSGRCPIELDGSFEGLQVEHHDADAALGRMRAVTNGFATLPEMCAVYRVLLNGLAQLESDLHQHMHEENDLLFPRACVAAALLRARALMEATPFEQAGGVCRRPPGA